MSGPQDDKAFEEYLKRGSPVSQHYQALDADEVPPELDRAVLGRAEAAVRPDGRANTQRWKRWSVPVGLAASTVLAVSIVIESGQHEETLTSAPSYPVPVRAEAPRGPVGQQQAESMLEEDAGARIGAASSDVADERAMAERSGVQLRASREGRDRHAEPAPATAPAAPPARTAELEAARAISNRDSAMAKERTGDQRLVRSRPDAALQPSPARSAAEVQPAPPSEAASDATFASEAKKARAKTSDPEEWLRTIRELRAAGKIEEANREWRAFREAYPQYVVAEDDLAIRR